VDSVSAMMRMLSISADSGISPGDCVNLGKAVLMWWKFSVRINGARILM